MQSPNFSTGFESLSRSEDTFLQGLLVEDNPGDAHLFGEYLKEGPVEATLRHEKTLQDGLGAIEEERPDVLVADLGLPDSEGTETVRTAAAAAPEVPIVVLTGRDDLQAALEAQEAGATEYLQKAELTPALVGRTLRWAVQRHHMQTQLQQRDAWIRSITERLSAGVFRAGTAGRIEYANRALAEMLGVDQVERLIGRDLMTFSTDQLHWDRMLEENGASDVEVEFDTHDGSSFVGLLNLKGAYDEHGDVVHYDGVITDITGRVQREKRLRMLSEALEQTKETVLITEAESLDRPGPRIVYANSAFEEVTGYAEKEILGKTPRILQGPDTERDKLDSLRAALEAGNSWSGETRNYRKNGEPYQVQWSVSPVRSEDGRIEHWVSVQRDITERRQRQRELERQNDFFEKAQKIAKVGAWEYDVLADESTWTEKAYHVVGLPTTADTAPENTLDLYHPEDRPRVRKAFNRALDEGEPFDLEARIGAGDEEKWVRTRGEPQNGEEQVARIRGTIRDITERKEREQDLRRAKEEAERMSHLKSAFLANMSHEIRTPLTSILGFADAIGAEVGGAQTAEDLDLATLDQFSSLIERSGHRLMDTLTGVLNLSKLQAGEMQLDLGPVDLTNEVKEVVEEFGPQAQEADICLGIQVEDGPVWARADDGGLQIVLRNLVSNAIKYTEEEGQVRVQARQEGSVAVVEVADTGIGMDPATVSSLFDAFKQASEGVEREYEGTGLGLTLTKEVLDRMGGSVEVETEQGEGSRFIVRLPRAEKAPSLS
jgi:PAS domain S-box-containing protein